MDPADEDDFHTVGVVWDDISIPGCDTTGGTSPLSCNQWHVFKVELNQIMPDPRVTEAMVASTTQMQSTVVQTTLDFWDAKSFGGWSASPSAVLLLALVPALSA